MSNPIRKIETITVLFVTIAALAASCATTGRPPEPEVAYYVYRGVGAKPNGNAGLSKSAFKFNGGEMSTFAATSTQSACFYQFVLDVPQIPPKLGDRGAVPGTGGFTAVFDDIPPGHWNLFPPDKVPPEEAAELISKFAQENREHHVVNGRQTNCY